MHEYLKALLFSSGVIMLGSSVSLMDDSDLLRLLLPSLFFSFSPFDSPLPFSFSNLLLALSSSFPSPVFSICLMLTLPVSDMASLFAFFESSSPLLSLPTSSFFFFFLGFSAFFCFSISIAASFSSSVGSGVTGLSRA